MMKLIPMITARDVNEQKRLYTLTFFAEGAEDGSQTYYQFPFETDNVLELKDLFDSCLWTFENQEFISVIDKYVNEVERFNNPMYKKGEDNA